MAGSIKLSPKHGVNPAMGQCFWCGEDDGTLVLMGRQPDDKEAPRHIVTSYQPCAKCQANMDKGVTFIEATTTANSKGQPPMGQGYPTGRWCVVKESAVREMVQEPLLSQMLKAHKTFIDPDAWDKVFGDVVAEANADEPQAK